MSQGIVAEFGIKSMGDYLHRMDPEELKGVVSPDKEIWPMVVNLATRYFAPSVPFSPENVTASVLKVRQNAENGGSVLCVLHVLSDDGQKILSSSPVGNPQDSSSDFFRKLVSKTLSDGAKVVSVTMTSPGSAPEIPEILSKLGVHVVSVDRWLGEPGETPQRLFEGGAPPEDHDIASGLGFRP